MLVYRLCSRRFRKLDGEGARLYGGRWNSPGHPAVYTASTLSLAVLEYLVHVDPDNLPADLVWSTIEILDTVNIEKYRGRRAPDETQAAAYGDMWLTECRSLCLEVPSAVLYPESNMILNPLHHDMHKVKVLHVKAFRFDPRLFKL
jgi:RES domain-containing protein